MLRFLQLDQNLTVILLARRVTVMMAGRQLRSWVMMVVSMIKRMMSKTLSFILSCAGVHPREHQE